MKIEDAQQKFIIQSRDITVVNGKRHQLNVCKFVLCGLICISIITPKTDLGHVSRRYKGEHQLLQLAPKMARLLSLAEPRLTILQAAPVSPPRMLL